MARSTDATPMKRPSKKTGIMQPFNHSIRKTNYMDTETLVLHNQNKLCPEFLNKKVGTNRGRHLVSSLFILSLIFNF